MRVSPQWKIRCGPTMCEHTLNLTWFQEPIVPVYGQDTLLNLPYVMLTNFYLWQGIFIFKYPVGLFFFFYNAHVILCKITYYFFMLYVI